MATLEPSQQLVDTLPLESRSEPISGQSHSPLENWTSYQKIAFRIAFVYIVLLCVPTAATWYQFLVKIDWIHSYWSDLSAVATSGSGPVWLTIATESGKWGLASYTNLALTFLVAVVIGLGWTFFAKRQQYNTLYYWVRVLARYRVGFALVAWGYKKLLPMQMVFPTMTILNTPLGDMQEQKLYWQSMGFVPGYEVFLGLAEFLGGILLLFRRTTALGAALTMVIMANVALANHAYDGSVHISSFYFALISAFILWYDLPSIWNLVVNQQDVSPFHYYPDFTINWQKYSRYGLKASGIALFVVVLFLLQWRDFDNYRLPVTPGLSNAKGYYNITEFRVNNRPLAYSPLDTLRWQDATLEDWSTLAVKVARKEVMDQSNGGSIRHGIGGVYIDIDRSWENGGIGGGRHFFYYTTNAATHELQLQNKNKAHRQEKLTLHYSQPTASRVVLTGTDEFNDSIYVVLDKVAKTYPLAEGRRHAELIAP